MKCPICGEELVRSKKDPNYLLCYHCKKKFRVAAKNGGEGQEQPVQNVRSAQRTSSAQTRQSAQRAQTRQTSQSRRQSRTATLADEYDEQYDPYEEEHLSNVPIVVLGIANVVVLGLIIFMIVL